MDVLKEFQDAIEIEYKKKLEDFEEQNKLPLDERVAKGVSMTNLRIEFDFFEGLPNQWCRSLSGSQKYISSVKIFCDNNISKFKEGNSVVLSNGSYSFEMNIEEDSTENFILKPNDFNVKYCYVDSTNYPINNWEINVVHTDIGTKMLRNTANYLEQNSTDLLRVENFLNGKTKNRFAKLVDNIEKLNESQNVAYINAINASDFCLIQGPPGTGKTTTIASIVNRLLIEGKKVFVTAPTHTAINNCLDSISKVVDVKWRSIKIGEKASNKEIQSNEIVEKLPRLQHHRWENFLKENEITENYGIAIGATAYSLCYPVTKRLEGWQFDVAIIDEASQLSIPLALAVMSRVKKVIFVGDHKQLDPIIPKNTNNEMFAESVFSRLARIYPNEINLLKTSYRLSSTLIEIPNTLFYNNQLQSDISLNEDQAEYRCTYHNKILNATSHTLMLHNVFDSKGRSPHESKLVAELVYDLLQNGVQLKNIGIMTPYRAQVREIKKEIKKRISIPSTKLFDDLFIDTVDSMQGQEREYIIYSMANSHPLESMRRLEFFYSPNRLNVAITRAIKKCFVIANYKVFDIIDDELKEHKDYQEIKDSLDIFKHYYSLSNKIEINQVVDDEW